ncbi:MAG: BON domain-containing protein [Pseudomonadota bacterium]
MQGSLGQDNPRQGSGVIGMAKRGGAGLKLGLLVGVVLGSGLMYIFYPGNYNRKRALARDKATSLLNHSIDTAGKTIRHLRNKLQGVMASATRAVSSEVVVSDRRLIDRIRSTIGRTISHPHSIDYAVHEGRVTVRGTLTQHEAGLVVQAIEEIPGVRSVDNQIIDGTQGATTVQ